MEEGKRNTPLAPLNRGDIRGSKFPLTKGGARRAGDVAIRDVTMEVSHGNKRSRFD